MVEKFGVGPELVGDVLALMGDSVDNVPGIYGIGPKTASKLIQDHGSLQGALDAAPDMKPGKLRDRRIEGREMAELSRVLVQLKEDCELPMPLDDFKLDTVPKEPLAAFLTEHGFTSLLRRLDGGSGSPARTTDLNPPKPHTAGAPAAPSGNRQAMPEFPPVDRTAYECVQTLERLGTQRLDRVLVHETRVEVADLAGIGIGRTVGGELLDDHLDLLLGLVGQCHERPPAGPIRGDLSGVEPVTVDVAEQVVLRANGVVHALTGVIENRHAWSLSSVRASLRARDRVGDNALTSAARITRGAYRASCASLRAYDRVGDNALRSAATITGGRAHLRDGPAHPPPDSSSPRCRQDQISAVSENAQVRMTMPASITPPAPSAKMPCSRS